MTGAEADGIARVHRAQGTGRRPHQPYEQQRFAVHGALHKPSATSVS